MKRLSLLICALFVCMAGFTQITFNVKAGFGIATVTGLNNDGGTSGKFVWKLGVGIEKPLSANWLLMPTLEYKQKGVEWSFNESNFSSTEKLTLRYIQLPIMGAYRLRLNDELNMTLKAGPYFAYGISAKYEINVEDYAEDIDPFEELCNRFDYGIAIGADIEYHRFVVGVEGEYGLGKLASDPDGEISIHNVGAYVTVGYKF